MTIADLRKEYQRGGLLESEADVDPINQFLKWLHQAVDAHHPEATAMTLATVSPEGRPAARILLLKECNHKGFVFFTNYCSRKGNELDHNPFAAMVFYWVELERQVRIEGRVVKTSEEESERYFHSRPVGSRLGA